MKIDIHRWNQGEYESDKLHLLNGLWIYSFKSTKTRAKHHIYAGSTNIFCSIRCHRNWIRYVTLTKDEWSVIMSSLSCEHIERRCGFIWNSYSFFISKEFQVVRKRSSIHFNYWKLLRTSHCCMLSLKTQWQAQMYRYIQHQSSRMKCVFANLWSYLFFSVLTRLVDTFLLINYQCEEWTDQTTQTTIIFCVYKSKLLSIMCMCLRYTKSWCFTTKSVNEIKQKISCS